MAGLREAFVVFIVFGILARCCTHLAPYLNLQLSVFLSSPPDGLMLRCVLDSKMSTSMRTDLTDTRQFKLTVGGVMGDAEVGTF